jgi:hypothetical protein
MNNQQAIDRLVKHLEWGWSTETVEAIKMGIHALEETKWIPCSERMPEEAAFDVEKVVKELEDLKMRYFLTLANTGDADKDCAYLNTANAIDKAIEIVKRGGIDEE